MAYFNNLFNWAEQQDRHILLVVSGCDGLTTNQGAFQKLFKLRPEYITVHPRIKSADLDHWEDRIPPPRLDDVDPLQVCATWTGDLDPDPDVGFKWSTKLYLQLVPAIATAKIDLADDFSIVSARLSPILPSHEMINLFRI